MYKFTITNGYLNIQNTENNNQVLNVPRAIVASNLLELYSVVPAACLYNSFCDNQNIFRKPLSECVDSTDTPFTADSFTEFCQTNLGFNTPGASGTITVEDSYLTLPPANTQSGKFYWCQNSEGVYLTGLYYSNGTTWETSQADEIKVEPNYAALPDPTTVPGQFYWCENSQGTKWLPGSLGGTYYSKGMYYSNGTSWSFLDVPYQATQSEVNAGLNDDKFVTPNTLANSDWSFTSSKVLATLLTGLSASAGTYTATDSILTAFNKLKYLLDNIATNTVPGIMKLYTTTGVNEDGAMTQKSITNALNSKIGQAVVTDTSNTSTISGFSSFNFKIIKEYNLGNGFVFVDYFIQGISNSPSTSFTLINNNSAFQRKETTVGVGNNGVVSNTNGVYVINSNSNIVLFFQNNSELPFTSGNQKTIRGNFLYYIAT